MSNLKAAQIRQAAVRELVHDMFVRLEHKQLSHCLGLANDALGKLDVRTMYTIELAGLDGLVSGLSCALELAREPAYAALRDSASTLLQRAIRLRWSAVRR